MSKAKKTFGDIIKSIVGAIAEPDETKRAAALAAIEKDTDMAMAAPPSAPPPPGGHDMSALREHLGKAIAAYGDGPHPEGHPVHAMKAAMDACGPAHTEPIGSGQEPGTLSKAHVEKMEALEKSNKELATSLAIEKGIRLDGEMREILKGFKATPFVMEGDNNDITRFRKMKETDPEGFERTIALMKATDAQLATSALFKNVGSGLSGSTKAWDQIAAKADTMVEKSTTPITREAAIEKVMLENPKLVEQYRAEQQ